jgi:DNA topoisomerase-1
MAKSLVIVESPAKQKTLSKFLGSSYLIRATIGHVIDLPKKTLGVDIEKGFLPNYVIIQSRKKVLAELKKAAKLTEIIYIATDPDREGEAIGWHIANYLAQKDNQVYRVMFNEITKSAVLAAISNPGTIDQNKVDAQQARRILDRLVGYQLSPLLWRKVRKGLSAGRVQSVAVRLVCEREDAIKKFIPEEYWSITAYFIAENIPFTAKLIQIDKKKCKITRKEEADKILSDLTGATYIVENVVTRPQQKSPPVPFTTSKLQQEAVRKLSFPTSKTMLIAQRLYEGLAIGAEGAIGLITYMRTDSTRIAQEAQQQARAYIQRKYGTEFVPESPRKYTPKGNIQDAHEAIRPTSIHLEPDAIKSYLTPEQYKLYKLIWERFVASQMSPAKFEVTSIDIGAKQYTFRATGTVMKFSGFTQIYMEGRDEKPNRELSDDTVLQPEEDLDKKTVVLPSVQPEQPVDFQRLEPKQHFTEPPPRYSEATLVKELEEQGIGRPSTYATIIKTIQERHYVQKLKGQFHPTHLGIVVNTLLVLHFPKIMEVTFTARMETELDKIEEGLMQWKEVLNDFYVPFSTALAEAQKTMRNVKKELSTPTGEKCEKCGAEMVIKWSKTGSFMACSAFPKCKNAKPIIMPKPITPSAVVTGENKSATGEKCDKCGAEMVIRTGRYGIFLACSQYPKCKNAKPIPIGICPVSGCGGQISTKRSRKGKVFYACSNYPKCTFATWDKPIFEKCPQCESLYLVEKLSKTEGKYYKCEKCEYKRIIETAESSQDSEEKTGL